MGQHLSEPAKEHERESYDIGYENGYQDAVNENTKTTPPHEWDRDAYDNGYTTGYERGLLELTER
jgi:hypothetical protein